MSFNLLHTMCSFQGTKDNLLDHPVEIRRFELLTPTLPVLCATNCANAPHSTLDILPRFSAFVKTYFSFFEKNKDVSAKNDGGCNQFALEEFL